MAVKKTIAIIGATGNMGSVIARKLAEGPYRLLLCSRHPETIDGLVHEIENHSPVAELEPVSCAFEAGWEADIIIAAVPPASENEVAQTIRDVATQKIVIRISKALANKSGETQTQNMETLLPYSKVVTVYHSFPGRELNKEDQIDLPITIDGNDREAVETVSQMITCAGLTAVIAKQ